MANRLGYVFVSMLFLTLLIFALWLGCGDTGTTVTSDDAVDGDDDLVDDDDDDNDDQQPPQPPIVDEPRTPTNLDYQTITGLTEPGAFIKVAGGAKEATTYADVENGEFCLVVELVLNNTNILSVTAEDEKGNVSEPTNIHIVQNRNNVCLGALADAASVSYSEPNSIPESAIDGGMLTYWANTTQPWHLEALRSPQWFRVELSQVETINRIDLYWTDNGYGTDFEIYVSDLTDEPIKPHASSNWKDEYTFVAAQTNPTSGFNGHNIFDLSENPIEAKWILVALYKSNQLNLLLYKYEIVELEAYSQESGETDPGCD